MNVLVSLFPAVIIVNAHAERRSHILEMCEPYSLEEGRNVNVLHVRDLPDLTVLSHMRKCTLAKCSNGMERLRPTTKRHVFP
jgi:hypothetical protein